MPQAAWDRYVLVVEDDPQVRDLYRSALRNAGYAVIAVEDGFDALKLVEGNCPAAVVLDLGLPRLSGRDVYKEMKARSETRRIPIVVVTGNDIRDLNLDDFACVLRKPITMDRLVAAVDNCLRRNGAALW